MKRICNNFYLEVGDVVLSTILNKKDVVKSIVYFGKKRDEGFAWFEGGGAYCSSESTYFKSCHHSCFEKDQSKGKGYIFIHNNKIHDNQHQNIQI